MEESEKISVLPQTRQVNCDKKSVVVLTRCQYHVLRFLALLSLIVIAALSIALAVVAVRSNIPPYCAKGLRSKDRDFDNPGVFNDLTPKEMTRVRDYLLAQSDLDLTPYEEARVNTSYIYMMTLMVPLKSAVLRYQTGLDRRPDRAAKVIIYRGDSDPPKVEEYVVGPLPDPRFFRVITNPAYRRIPIPFSSRPVDTVERSELHKFLSIASSDLHTLFKESYELSLRNCTPRVDCLIFEDFGPRGTESGERMTWFWAYRDTSGYYLHPLGFALQVNHLSPNPSEWTVSRVLYYGQLFRDVKELVLHYAEGSIRKIKPVMDKIDAQFSTFEQRGHHSFDTPLRGPRLLEPDGHRYKITDQFVEYFGWSFNFHMRTDIGLQIFDVYFQSERVGYEFSLQEITAFHTGYSPETAWLGLYGVSWLLGTASYELVPGVDCSATASFIDSYHFANSGTPKKFKNSICIFEQTSGMPLRRHHSHKRNGDFDSYGGLVSSSLVVRTAISLWSSDYIVDYIFHLDGTIELKISLSGYVQASYDLYGQRPYGNRLHDTARGNLHQHLFHWKIDLDIESTENRYQTFDFSTESGSSFWYEGAVNKTQLKFDASLKTEEKSAKVGYDFDHPQHYVIYNKEAPNRYGAPKAYQIINDAKTKFLLENSAITNAASWAHNQIAVTKYKDTEDSSSSIYAQGDPFDPILNFSRFVEDNDTIVDTDIILWVTSGLYHIPHAEDVPSTSTTTSQCRVFLRPYNFFNYCPSMAVSDALLIKAKKSVDSSNENEKLSKSQNDLIFETYVTATGEPKCYQKEGNVLDFKGYVEDAS